MSLCWSISLVFSVLTKTFQKFPQEEIQGLEESKKSLAEENQRLLERICALEDKQVCMFNLMLLYPLSFAKTGMTFQSTTFNFSKENVGFLDP